MAFKVWITNPDQREQSKISFKASCHLDRREKSPWRKGCPLGDISSLRFPRYDNRFSILSNIEQEYQYALVFRPSM